MAPLVVTEIIRLGQTQTVRILQKSNVGHTGTAPESTCDWFELLVLLALGCSVLEMRDFTIYTMKEEKKKERKKNYTPQYFFLSSFLSCFSSFLYIQTGTKSRLKQY